MAGVGACVLMACLVRGGLAAEQTRGDDKSLPADKGALVLHSIPDARFHFNGVLGQRIHANVENWLLRAPQANPGMLEMFRLRDRKPEPNLVPWAGEFVGKYLISAIQTLRLSDNPALEKQAREVITALIVSQAEDGYLGPFPKAIRLTGNWDLWGHYHVVQALLLWHEATGDPAALAACRRAADLICHTFLDAPQRVFDAGSHEMNMAVIHGLGQLYRRTGEGRYLRLMREIEKDWERAGDYFRTGLAGKEFFETPRPRWESLHDLQGLLELCRITGDSRYRTAFEHHWRSILRWDRHNTGGFSSGEQATGNPYGPGAIETCCTVAWMALSIDMLRLTGDPLVADELELSTYNGGLGSQHPSGRWWTYNTPMDGTREASAHSIVFQARAGTPELNCCSVNGPRALGLLAEWTLMTDADGLVVNGYSAGDFRVRLRDGTPVRLQCATDYPLDGNVRLQIDPDASRVFTVKFRIPAWSAKSRWRLGGGQWEPIPAGCYQELRRSWQTGDVVELEFDLGLRAVAGDREAAGKISLYRGPLLLAWDQRLNQFDDDAIPALDLVRLKEANSAPRSLRDFPLSSVAPWVLLDVPTIGGGWMRVCDFASAGAAGSRYRSWLVASNCPPPPVVTRRPADGAVLPLAATRFQWTGPRKAGGQVSEYRFVVADDRELLEPRLELRGLKENRVVLNEPQLQQLPLGRTLYWKVAAVNSHGATDAVGPRSRFKIDPTLPPPPRDEPELQQGPNAELVKADLHGNPKPAFGRLLGSSSSPPAAGPDGQPGHAVELDGQSQMLRYAIEEFPEEDYSVTVRVRFSELPRNRLGQVFSAWCAPMDDPLRICVEKGKLFARIESGQGYSTPGAVVEPGRWYHVAAVKSGSQLTLFVEGKAVGSATVPLFVTTRAQDVALGGNPHYSGNECLAARFADFAFYARALSVHEVGELAGAK
jgi:hypothetical protein